MTSHERTLRDVPSLQPHDTPKRRGARPHARGPIALCVIGALEFLACGGETHIEAEDIALVAGAGDRYGCITTSEPGCDLGVGIGQSLFGAGECRPGLDFHVTSSDRDRAHPLVLAIHGGGIEGGTAEYADLLGATLGWDTYVFRAAPASASCGDVRWMHVTSARFNSATARALARSHPRAVSLHGYDETQRDRQRWPAAAKTYTLCVGGSDARGRAAFIASMSQPPLVLDGRTVRAVDASGADDRTSTVCGGLAGTSADNVVNLPPGRGVQLELPRHVRARLVGLDGLAPSAALRARMLAAIRAAVTP